MPFHRRAVACRLHVEFAAVESDVGAEQLAKNGGDLGLAHEIVEEFEALEDDGFQPSDPGQRRRVAGLEVIKLVIGRHAAGIRHDAIGQCAQLGELCAPDQPGDHQVAVAAIRLDLRVGEHAKQ